MNKITIFLLLLFVMQMPAFADELSCKTGMQDLLALFSPKTVNCDNNQFLPANSVICSNCPNGYTCSGGDLVFNETNSSGIDYTKNITNNANNVCADNFPRELYAIFTPKTFICDPGYYLPTNTDYCTICPVNNYCPGGTYIFNEQKTQGLYECPSGKFSPVGAAVCYEHKLHIGNEALYLRSSKRTIPSLNVGYGNDVFYANMTTTQTYMTAGSTHYFKTIYNDMVYYICDDTTYNVEN